jgi:hypothetical protein
MKLIIGTDPCQACARITPSASISTASKLAIVKTGAHVSSYCWLSLSSNYAMKNTGIGSSNQESCKMKPWILNDDELCFGCHESVSSADLLKEAYQKLRGAYDAQEAHITVMREALIDIRHRVLDRHIGQSELLSQLAIASIAAIAGDALEIEG